MSTWHQIRPSWSTADEYDVDLIVREARAVQGLTRRDMPAGEIARILAVTPRTVYRWRSEGFRQAA